MYDLKTNPRPTVAHHARPARLDHKAAPWRRLERPERKLPELEWFAAEAVLSRAELQALVAEMLG